jgi:putative ABC transport system permease protein
MRRQPFLTFAIVLTLGLAIGANTAIFSFVNALLIRPFPFRDAEQLAEIRSVRGGQPGKLSMREILDIKEQIPILESIAAHSGGAGGYNYSGEGRPQEWRAVLATGNLFEVLGVPLAAGRPWPEDADRIRYDRVVLTYGTWRDVFGGGNVTGRAITLDHAPGYIVEGVAAAGFDFPSGTEIYRSIGGFTSRDKRDSRNVVGIARLKPHYSLPHLQAELDAVSSRLERQYPASNAGIRFKAESFRDLYSGPVRPWLLILLGAVGFVLVIACANVANLLLSRATGREREIAIRIALGADRKDIITQLLTESTLLALLSAGAGLLLAAWWMTALRSLIGGQLPQWLSIQMDERVLVFTLGVSILTGIAAGLLPASQLSRTSHHESLKEGSRGSSGGKATGRIRNLLVVGEVAMAVVLLATAGHLIERFIRLQAQNKGFDSTSVATFRVALGWKRYIDQASTARYYEKALDGLRSMPGVSAVAFASNPPLARQEETAPDTVQREGQELTESRRNPYVNHQSVSASYLPTAKIPLRAGRQFSEFDSVGAEPVTIVSERLASILWPGQNPIGRRLRHAQGARAPGEYRRVIGIAANVQHRALGGEPSLDMYVPYRQRAEANQYFLARTTLSANEFRTRAERVLWAIDSEQSAFDFQSYDKRILDSIWQLRLSRMLLVLLGGVALALASIGIYGVISFVVGQRTREIGIRLALGASPASVRRLVVRQGLGLGCLGIGIGAVAAVASTRTLASLLPALPDQDTAFASAMTAASVLAILLAATFAASALPAWRASRLSPGSLLRAD